MSRNGPNCPQLRQACVQRASKISWAVKWIAICVESNARNASGERWTIALYGGKLSTRARARQLIALKSVRLCKSSMLKMEWMISSGRASKSPMLEGEAVYPASKIVRCCSRPLSSGQMSLEGLKLNRHSGQFRARPGQKAEFVRSQACRRRHLCIVISEEMLDLQ